MSGVLALLPGFAPPMPAGFFGTRFTVQFTDNGSSFTPTTMHINPIGAPDLGAPIVLSFDTVGTVWATNLRFDSPLNPTFDTTYPNCDFYRDGVFLYTLTRAGKAGTRPSWSKTGGSNNAGIVEGRIHVIDAFYRA